MTRGRCVLHLVDRTVVLPWLLATWRIRSGEEVNRLCLKSGDVFNPEAVLTLSTDGVPTRFSSDAWFWASRSRPTTLLPTYHPSVWVRWEDEEVVSEDALELLTQWSTLVRSTCIFANAAAVPSIFAIPDLPFIDVLMVEDEFDAVAEHPEGWPSWREEHRQTGKTILLASTALGLPPVINFARANGLEFAVDDYRLSLHHAVAGFFC